MLLMVGLVGLSGSMGEAGQPTGGGGMVQIDPDAMPLVAITFDDGPKQGTTDVLLDGLALREVPATFFLIGSQIPGNEDLVARMAAEGHQIGIHTFDHVKVTGLTREEFDQQIGKTRTLVAEVAGPGDSWLRPPYGLVNDRELSWADGPLILWSVDPEDWKDRNTQRIKSAVLERVKDGDIILLHDIYGSSVQAALDIVDGLKERGYSFVTVEQLMAARGVSPEAGAKYRAFPPKQG